MFFIFTLLPIHNDDVFYIYSIKRTYEAENLLYATLSPLDNKLWFFVDMAKGESNISRKLILFKKEEAWIAGIYYFFLGDYHKAEKYFSMALKSRSQPPLFTLYFIAWTLYFQNAPEDALNAFLNLQDFAPKSFDPHEISLMIAYQYLRLKEYKKALSYLKLPPEDKKQKEFFFLLRASIYEKMDSLERAEKDLKKIKHSPLASYLLSLIYLKKGKETQAWKLLERKYPEYMKKYISYAKAFIYYNKKNYKKTLEIIKEQQDKNASLLTALCYEKIRNLKKAEEKLKKYIREYGYEESILKELLYLLYTRKKYKEVIDYAELFRKRYQDSPSLSFVKYLEAISYLKTQETQKAENLLKELIEEEYAQPFIDEVNLKLGDIYFAKGKCATAIEYYKKVRLQEYKVKSLKKILDCTMMEKDYRTALSVIEELIKNKSVKEKDELLLQREWIRFKLGKYRDSIAYLTGFIKKYPSSKLVPSLRLKIASILLENKKFYQAIHELQKIREKYPEYTSQANLLLAKAKEEMGDYKGALKVLQNVQDPEILLKRARIKEKLGMYGEALTDIIAARKKFPCIADEMLGNIYRKLGRKKEATLVFLRVYRQCRKQAYNAFLQLCEIEIEEGSFKRVKEMLKEGIKRFGNTPEILYLNALKERMEGNFENAYLQLTEALSKETSLNWKIKIINALTMIAVPIDKKEEVKKILEEEAKSSEDPLYRGRIKDILKKFK